MCEDCQSTNPLSSNQIIEVGLKKAKCLDFTDNTLNDWLKFLSEEICCLKTNNEEEVIDLTVNNNWDIYRQPQLYKKGNFYKLTGIVGGGDISSYICTLPVTPNYAMIFPIAHEFDPSTDFNLFLKIDVDRSLKLYFTGTVPTGASSKLYLDNVSFFIE